MFEGIKKRTLILLSSCLVFIYETYANNKEPLIIWAQGMSSGEIQNDTIPRIKRIYTTTRTAIPPLIDGKLNDSCWHSGQWQTDYSQYVPVYGGNPSGRTGLKILYDDKYIYVAIRAYDDMKRITRRLGRRDNFDGDIVGVIFDSYFDHRSAFEFDITAAGQKLDVWVSNDGWDTNWDAVWDGKVAYEDSAWTAEMRIPLSQLRYSSSPTQVWGLNSWRLINRLQEESHWNLIANDGTGQVYTFGELHGITGMKRAKRIELAPYLSTKLSTSQKIPNNPFAKGSRFEVRGGLDAKIGITNNFTLNATINPDFGQVESDPSVMNLTAFETYFEEKRPFFTEGKNILEYSFDGDQLFYSRRIGHTPSYQPAYDTIRIPEFTNIGAAFKFSGKTQKGLSLGIIESLTPQVMADIHDQNNNFKSPAEPFSNYFIGRFQQDFDKGNTIIGGIITHTHRSVNTNELQFLSGNAMTGGFEFTRYWKDRKYFVEAKTIGSTINGDHIAISKLQSSSARYFQRPDIKGIGYDTSRTYLNGAGASFKIGKWSKGHWRYNEEFIYRSPGLEVNDLGYMTLANLVKNNINIAYYERKNTKVFRNYTFIFQHQRAWDAGGLPVYSYDKLSSQAEFMNNWSALFTVQYTYDNLDEWVLRGGPSMKVPGILSYTWQFQSSGAKKFVFVFNGIQKTGLQKSLNQVQLIPELRFRPRSNLGLSLQTMYSSNKDELQFISRLNQTNGNTVYLLGRVENRNLGFSFRADLAITPEFTIQYYGSPFVSIGKYSRFKKVLNPKEPVYASRFELLDPAVNGQTYNFDDNHDGTIDFTITNPDFSYQQFRSNFVVRWEYKTGSVVYLVWSQDRTSFEQPGYFNFGRGFNTMFDIFPGNVFMVKFNYLFRK